MVIATVMAAAPHSSLLPGVLVEFPGSEKPNEVDIYGIWHGRVVCGEVKTKATEFTPEQVRKDVAVAQRLGSDVYLMAATDAIHRELRDLAAKECDDTGLSLEVLSRSELILTRAAAAQTE
ncbi:hypothetical protein [Glycomyces niveus]|uniref:Restriction endonuclease type IV Mrr domain-containing protein n=1 Tax=Glycomyces niveus TaxID=2820287 RepID=A0ABS3U2W7_9ACTN|nr:hypothetical protein [Glycomyces sp. NEAU-S30]MBO3733120.1 hypothetical protein [Glycomyces sp. NEAU-S30]